MISQKKLGVTFSYINTIFNALLNIILVPLFISNLGAAEYGVYKIMNSFAGYLFIMDMGIGTIVTRYVALFRHKEDEEGIKKCIATSTVVCAILCLAVALIGLFLRIQISVIYSSSLTSNQLDLARRLFSIMIINIIVTLITHLFTGYINAYERFAYTNGMSVLRLIVRFIALFIGVTKTRSALSIVLIDLGINTSLLAIYILYCFVKLKMQICVVMFDRSLVKQYTIFSGAILFQSIVNQVNNSVDNVILGAMVSPEIVTMYSSGLTIYGFYVTMPDAINHVFLPQATRMFGEKLPDDDGRSLTNFVSRIGRYEAILCLGIMGAFISFGKDFVLLWVGNENIGAWSVALLLMIPVTIPMCENLMVTVLNACNKRMFRSLVLAGVAVFNVITTILLIPKLGYVGAAIGTFLSILIGHGIILNIYYKKVFKLRILEMLKMVYLKTLPCSVATCLIMFLFSNLFDVITWKGFIIKSVIYMLIYGVLVCVVALTKSERERIKFFVLSFIKNK